MSTLLSPQEVYDEPFRWLNVPHGMHESLGKLMPLMFEDWESKLTDVHCLECEGEEPFIVYEKEGLVPKLCTGFLRGKDGEVAWLNLKDPEEG